MILGSILPPSKSLFSWRNPEAVVPQTQAALTDDDNRIFKGRGVPTDQADNLKALLALYKKSSNYRVVSTHVSRAGMELSRTEAMQHIRYFVEHAKTNTSRLFFTPCQKLYYCAITLQLFFITMAMAGGTQVTGVLVMSVSSSKKLLTST